MQPKKAVHWAIPAPPRAVQARVKVRSGPRPPPGLPDRFPIYAPPVPDWMNEPQPLVNPFHLEPTESGLQKFYRRHSLIFHIPLALFIWHVSFITSAVIAILLDPIKNQKNTQDFRIIYSPLVGGLVLDPLFMMLLIYLRTGYIHAKMGITNAACLSIHQVFIPHVLFSLPIGIAIIEVVTNSPILPFSIAILSSFLGASIVALIVFLFILERHFSASPERFNTKRQIQGFRDFITLGPLGRLRKADHEDAPWVRDMP